MLLLLRGAPLFNLHSSLRYTILPLSLIVFCSLPFLFVAINFVLLLYYCYIYNRLYILYVMCTP